MLCVVAFGLDGRGQGLLGKRECADGVWGGRCGRVGWVFGSGRRGFRCLFWV